MDRIIPFPLSPVSQIDVQTLQDLWSIQTVPSHTPQGHWLVAQPGSWKVLRQTLGRICKATEKTGALRSLYWDHRLRVGRRDATTPWDLAAASLASPRLVPTASASPLPQM